jgi:diaminopimelate decarboxylase
VFFVVAAAVADEPGRRLYAAAGAAVVLVVFVVRMRRYQAVSVDTLVFEVLAQTRPPRALADAATRSGSPATP